MAFDDIVDLKLDENFDVYVDHRGDLATVSGREAFEQRLILRLTERLGDLIGRSSVEDGTVVQLAENHIGRVAQQSDRIDNVAAYNAEFSDERPGVLEVEVIFDSGEPLTFDIEQ